MSSIISIGDYNHPTATISYSRQGIFAPVKRISPAEIKKNQKNNTEPAPIVFETPYGTCTLIQKPRLTQIHRDIIEAVLTFHKKICFNSDGDITYLIKPYEIMNIMGRKTNDIHWFKKKLDDMQKTKLVVKESGWTVHSGIIIRYKYLNLNTTSNKYGNGNLFAIQFSAEFLRSFSLELNVHYPRLVGDILAIKSPLVRATIRYFLTQTHQNLGVEKLLRILGVTDISGRACRMKGQELKNNANELEKFGIFIIGNTCFYKQNEFVWFTKPKCINPKSIEEQRKSNHAEAEVLSYDTEAQSYGVGS